MDTHLAQFQRFAQYNSWFNSQLYELTSSLTDEERHRDVGAYFQSLHGTLSHILLTDRLWLGRFSKHANGFAALADNALVFEFESLSEILYPTFSELAEQRRATDAVIESWVAELSSELLAGDLAYVNSSGRSMVAPFWHVVAHLFNHQTHHRGQVTALLFQLGHDPGVTDFMITVFMPQCSA